MTDFVDVLKLAAQRAAPVRCQSCSSSDLLSRDLLSQRFIGSFVETRFCGTCGQIQGQWPVRLVPFAG